MNATALGLADPAGGRTSVITHRNLAVSNIYISVFGQNAPYSLYVLFCRYILSQATHRYISRSAAPWEEPTSSYSRAHVLISLECLHTIYTNLTYFFKYVKQPSKHRPPLPSADRPLLRLRGRSLSVHATNEHVNYFKIS